MIQLKTNKKKSTKRKASCHKDYVNSADDDFVDILGILDDSEDKLTPRQIEERRISDNKLFELKVKNLLMLIPVSFRESPIKNITLTNIKNILNSYTITYTDNDVIFIRNHLLNVRKHGGDYDDPGFTR